jgi:3-oxoacyl-[acyl-carrier-protein] synthase-1
VARRAIRIERTGLVNSVGASAAAACAAMRSRLSNPTETRLSNLQGEWIIAHQVTLARPWRGVHKLARMAAMAIAECLQPLQASAWDGVPLLLCVAESRRPDRIHELDTRLLDEVRQLLQARFGPGSMVIPHGRVGVGIALFHARRMLLEGSATQVLVAAADSLLVQSVLRAYESEDRLLTPGNSNGLIPGEAGAAVLLALPSDGPAGLLVSGIGFGIEPAHVVSDLPLRADGLAAALQAALAEAGRGLHELDFRITDLSGEQYYFKEAALAVGRVLRGHKSSFDLWHPAECIGETGAAAGLTLLALADDACRQGYAPGPRVLVHAGSDTGQRMAAVLEFGQLQ